MDLLNGDIDKSLRTLGFPLAFAFILHIINGWVDKLYVSRLGGDSLAALGVSDQLGLLVFTLAIGFAIGTGVIVARKLGEGTEKSKKEANETAVQAFAIMFFYSIAISIIFHFTASPLLDLLGYEKLVKTESVQYLSALVLGFPFLFLIVQLNAIIRSTGNTVYPMAIIAVTILINAVLTPLLVFDFILPEGLGIYGAGLGTAIANLLGLLINLYTINRGYTDFKLEFHKFSFNTKILSQIISKGIPSTLQYLSISINRIAMFSLVNYFGTNAVAAYTLGLSFDLFVFMPIMGAGVALEIASGQNRGAKKIKRIFAYFNSAVKQSLFILVPMIIIAQFIGSEFAGLFSDDSEIKYLTSSYLKVTSLAYIFFSVAVFGTRVISGAGDTQRSFVIYSIIMIVVQIPLSYLLSIHLDFGSSGIWWGIFLSYLLFMLISLSELYRRKWLNIKN